MSIDRVLTSLATHLPAGWALSHGPDGWDLWYAEPTGTHLEARDGDHVATVHLSTAQLVASGSFSSVARAAIAGRHLWVRPDAFSLPVGDAADSTVPPPRPAGPPSLAVGAVQPCTCTAGCVLCAGTGDVPADLVVTVTRGRCAEVSWLDAGEPLGPLMEALDDRHGDGIWLVDGHALDGTGEIGAHWRDASWRTGLGLVHELLVDAPGAGSRDTVGRVRSVSFEIVDRADTDTALDVASSACWEVGTRLWIWPGQLSVNDEDQGWALGVGTSPQDVTEVTVAWELPVALAALAHQILHAF